MDDTIVARATPPGEGAIAIIRISGPQTFALIEKCFKPTHPSSVKYNYLILGELLDPATNTTIDQVFCVRFKQPHSYTGEDAAELHCHGGPAIVTQALDMLCRLGARMAEPGEFTKRAFLNGKIDLTRAEAICDIIRSRTQKASSLALKQLQGKLAEEIGTVRQNIITVSAEIEARLDFPDEELGSMDTPTLLATINSCLKTLHTLIRDGTSARIYRNGARVVLAGKPNTGKSSLFNTLLGRERAIVTPHPGTTRDSIEGTADLMGCPITYIDTAGLRQQAGEVERLGIARAQSEIASADLILLLIDSSTPLDEEDLGILQNLSDSKYLVVLNKIDLPTVVGEAEIGQFVKGAQGIVRVSALTGEGVESLERKVMQVLIGDVAASEDALVTNERHIDLLRRAAASLRDARDGIAAKIPEELVMVDIRRSLNALGQITGEHIREEILDSIFSQFCIGK